MGSRQIDVAVADHDGIFRQGPGGEQGLELLPLLNPDVPAVDKLKIVPDTVSF